ncbi:hypothetical protein GV828_03460 [Flavobacterium sp. NST-5]|uniref:GOLD domain-containing protein n=1 Tax=Flavobacterium ichthyis TaxID=2698827 RepID=A0ABW9Z7U4_9FLAO|nr:hypothetical protein [Flavobacterium ichthyis]NBL64256.1 hypothetical protein [Flavobacterium ichthyis]
MKKNTLLILLFIFSFFLNACSGDEGGQTIVFEEALVTAAEGPATVTVNQSATYTLTYQTKNDCGNFENFVETLTGTTKTISVRLKYVGDCNENVQTKTITYPFMVNTPGTYTFKFRNTSTSFLTRTVVVTE